MIRRLFLRIKRRLFYWFTGFYPEDIKRLVYVQKYLDKIERKNQNYNDYIKSHFKESKKCKEYGDFHAPECK